MKKFFHLMCFMSYSIMTFCLSTHIKYLDHLSLLLTCWHFFQIIWYAETYTYSLMNEKLKKMRPYILPTCLFFLDTSFTYWSQCIVYIVGGCIKSVIWVSLFIFFASDILKCFFKHWSACLPVFCLSSVWFTKQLEIGFVIIYYSCVFYKMLYWVNYHTEVFQAVIWNL